LPPVLIGDIGGTHARFAIVPELRGELEIFSGYADERL